MDTNESLTLASLLIAKWARKQSSHGFRDRDYAQAQQHKLPLTEVTWIQLLFRAQSASIH